MYRYGEYENFIRETNSNPWSQKIIAGSDANRGSWPWMVSLRKSYNSDHYCGGVLISGNRDQIILILHHVFERKSRDRTVKGFTDQNRLAQIKDRTRLRPRKTWNVLGPVRTDRCRSMDPWFIWVELEFLIWSLYEDEYVLTAAHCIYLGKNKIISSINPFSSLLTKI